MQELMEFMKQFNVQILLGVTLIVWAFTANLKREMKEEMRTMMARTDRLYEMFIDLLKEKRP